MTALRQVPLEELRAYRLLIGTPMYAGSCSGHYANASIRLAMQLQAAGIRFGFAFVLNESLITRARNHIAASFMSSPVGYTHLMLIDADIDYRPDDVLCALAVQHAHRADKDIVCAAYPRKRIAWDKVRHAVKAGVADADASVLENYVGDFVVGRDESSSAAVLPDLVEVTTAGTGFMLVTRRVFEAFDAAFPDLRYTRDDEDADAQAMGLPREVMCYFDAGIDPATRTYLSEDYAFLRKARALGHAAWLIPWIDLGHVGSYRFAGNLRAVHGLGGASP